MTTERIDIEERMVIAENYSKLASAIVKQAIGEYKAELRRVAERVKDDENPDSLCYSPKIREIEEFLLSDWFVVLCNLDGRAVIEGLRADILHSEDDEEDYSLAEFIEREGRRREIE